jgi:hypothetical protein
MDKIIATALKVLDIFPGLKTNTGAILLLITTVMQLAGADAPLIEVVKKIAEALLSYGLVMKNIRK